VVPRVRAPCFRKQRKDRKKITIGVFAIALSRLDKAEDTAGRLRSGIGAREQPILAADDEGADRVLRLIVIGRQPLMVEKTLKLVPLAQKIGEGRTGFTRRKNFGLCLLRPELELD
jgi:hypothetical protein